MISIDLAAAPASPNGKLTRQHLLLGLFLLCGFNAWAGHALRSVGEGGLAASILNLFGISAIVWAAFAAAGRILLEPGEDEAPTRGDYVVGALTLPATLLPFATAGMLALSLIALYAAATSRPGTRIRRAAIIFLAMSGVLLWGRLVLAAFSTAFLAADAVFVSTLIGSEHAGNMLWYEGSPTRLVVAPGCSSMQGISLSILLWATVNQLFEIPFGWRPFLWCLAAIAATIAVNVLRIASMLTFPGHLDALHNGWGFHLFMWLTLAAVAVICIYGGRRHVFARL